MESVRHAFFTRENGVSKGVYASLNCGYGSGDVQDLVARNRAICAAALSVDPDRLLTVHQEHTPDVVTVTAPWPRENAPVADAMVTRQPGIGLGVLAADCTPVLFADEEHAVVGAAHAGWKGAFSGILANTITAMINLGAELETIYVAVGPCIGPASYEVGPEFHDRFVVADKSFGGFFRPAEKKGHWMFDMAAFVIARLRDAGLHNVEHVAADTYPDEHGFFSYRRSCHRGESQYGRQLSVIALTDD